MPSTSKTQSTAPPKQHRSKPSARTVSNSLYTLEVFIITGPIAPKFAKQHPEISRQIEIKGSQTLADLHQILFTAYDREEEHLYEFQIGGRGPNDPNAQRYGLKQPFMGSMFPDEAPVEDVSTTTIASLGLSVDDAFGYWFDFGDDWWHQINVIDIADTVPKGKYPRITARVGDSPPQYADFE